MEEDRLANAKSALEVAKGDLERERDTYHLRDDPRGRYVSIAITHIEDALLRVDAVIAVNAAG